MDFRVGRNQQCTTTCTHHSVAGLEGNALFAYLVGLRLMYFIESRYGGYIGRWAQFLLDMKAELIYVELKTGYSDNGPAWIGKGFYNRTRKTVYFNGQVFCRSQGISSNHIDLETGEEYWISGVKKKGADRHWAGSGTIKIDKGVIADYLDLRGLKSLTKGKYEIVTLDNEPATETSKHLENFKSTDNFNDSLRFKEISDLTDTELVELIDYYDNLDLASIHKKARKEYIDKINELKELKEIREVKTAPNTQI